MGTSTTIKIWKTTVTNLRMLYALTGRPMIEILDRIVKKELDDMRKTEETN